MPVLDWIFAFAGAFAAGYLYLFYNELATRPGAPTQFDVVVGVIGILLLLEATRRAVGLPMAVLAVIFLVYVLAGAYLPDVIAHKGASIPRTISHMWLVTEGVFGIALGVSVAFIFVFVLFGTLLDRAGGGNYMMQVSFALLGSHARRAGKSRGRVVGIERLDLRLVGQQRRLRRHLHDSADEEGGLRRRQGGGDRNVVVGQRPDHAAGDGRRGVSDGRVRRDSLFGNHPARLHSGGDQLHRAVLHRASGGDAARHGADGESARADRRRSAAGVGARARGNDRCDSARSTTSRSARRWSSALRLPGFSARC